MCTSSKWKSSMLFKLKLNNSVTKLYNTCMCIANKKAKAKIKTNQQSATVAATAKQKNNN